MNQVAEPISSLNGVDVAAALAAREAFAAAPEAAQFAWEASCEWVSGSHCRTTIHKFTAGGEPHAHRQRFVLEGDHPEMFAAEDLAPTPVESVLAALAGCLSAGVASIAANRGVEVRSVLAHLRAHQDLRGILGVDPDVRNGFSGIEVRFDVDSDAPAADIEAIVAQSQKRSAVFDMLTNPTNVVVEVG